METDELDFENWEDIVEELDAYPTLRDKEAEFIISLIENPPQRLSPRQVQWLEDMKRKYLQ